MLGESVLCPPVRPDMMSPMKKLLAIIILSLCFITPSQADGIKDFQLEGMSVGDSLLDYFSESEIKKFKRQTAFKDKTYSRYLIINHKNHSSKFDALRIYTKTNDKKYIIAQLAGLKKFKNAFDKCLEEKKIVLKDIKLAIGESQNYKFFELKKRVRLQDKSGKSYENLSVYDFNNNDQIKLACINWSQKMKFTDMLDLVIMNDEVGEWLTKANKQIR